MAQLAIRERLLLPLLLQGIAKTLLLLLRV
jgi:hypothetical protein